MANQEDSRQGNIPPTQGNIPAPADPVPGPSFDEVWFDDPAEGEAAQRAALELKHRIELRAKPIRFYLEETIAPLLLQGLQHLVLERPSNPVQYLAAFLLKNDPHPPPQQIEVSFEDAASKYAAAAEQGEKPAPA